MDYWDLLSRSPGVIKGAVGALVLISTGITLSVNLTHPQAERAAGVISPSQSQRDNYTAPERTCNSTANAIFLNYFRAFNQDPARQGFVKDDDYLQSVVNRGDTTSHDVQTTTLKAYGLKSYWDTSNDIDKLRTTLAAGYPVVVNLLHRGKVGSCGKGVLRGGHVVVIRSSFTDDNGVVMLKVTDPYGQLCSNYENHSTDYSISLSQFRARWQGGARYVRSTDLLS